MRNILWLLALAASLLNAHAQSRYATLKVNGNPETGPVLLTNEITIGAFEAAQVVTAFGGGTFDMVKDGSNFGFSPSSTSLTATVVIMSGPVTFRLSVPSGYSPAFVTLKITPEAFPPDKTIIIPQGTTGANVVMESSTNLTQWATATNGFYSGSNAAIFFRIRAERAP